MAIAASGAVSFSDLRTEFVGGSSAISISDLYRGGSNILSKAGDNPAVNMAASVPTSGVIDIQDFHGTAKAFKNTVSSSTTNVDADALFGDDYDVNYPKIIDINSGVTIGGSGDEAIDIPSGLAGSLTINNAGIVIGFGGASAGAAGGSAINCAASGVTINNTGQISGGGGAGNVGGAGGNGSYTTSSTVNETRQFYSQYYSSVQVTNDGTFWMYNGSSASSSRSNGSACVPCHPAGYLVSQGNYVSYGWYKIALSGNWTTSTTNSSTGGAGGSFGVGAGYNQSATNGTSGASGSNNAGNGGAGSNGAALGTAAATSSAGSNGNVSNGAAGNAGGAAGAAVTGTSVAMNNTGTLHGAVA